MSCGIQANHADQTNKNAGGSPITDPDFNYDDIISIYSRREALEDGSQVDANSETFSDVTRQYFKIPAFMTQGVYQEISLAVENNQGAMDYKGIWSDICTMCLSPRAQHPDEATNVFEVLIDRGIVKMKAEVGPMDFDDPSPAITFSLFNED